MRDCALRIEIGSDAELLFCLGRIALAHLRHTKRSMASGKIIIQTDGLVCVFRCELHPLRIRIGTVLVVISFAQSGITRRGLGIELDRSLQELDRTIDTAIAIRVIQIFPSAPEQGVGIVFHWRFLRSGGLSRIRLSKPAPAPDRRQNQQHEEAGGHPYLPFREAPQPGTRRPLAATRSRLRPWFEPASRFSSPVCAKSETPEAWEHPAASGLDP